MLRDVLFRSMALTLHQPIRIRAFVELRYDLPLRKQQDIYNATIRLPQECLTPASSNAKAQWKEKVDGHCLVSLGLSCGYPFDNRGEEPTQLSQHSLRLTKLDSSRILIDSW